MKTKIISITSAATTQALKTCQQHHIKCTYIGIRESNDILMELSYNESQDTLISQLTDYLEEAARGADEMRMVINDLIDKSAIEQQEPLRALFAAIKVQILHPFKN